ncbi:MAG: rhomboid family intramembrane serine protease [Micavibrio aeruginosavorus]|uniref:Rhomboid family intramembrane serine protease n=1 Tax=Micavibrio aeruginosavorus TaxID=349221 RepID=A0A2W5A0W5_9BACT|nr:MAG: rhomboid family intramembrane serine protease [Micavibrio aeruginosavorus]
MGTYLNGNDNTPGWNKENDKIVVLPTLAERDKARRDQEKAQAQANAEPMINMPPVTLTLILVILGIHLGMNYVLPDDIAGWIIMNLGFVPEAFNTTPLNPPVLASTITHMFLHGSWMHVVMNIFMLAAFGSGIERWLGSRRLLILFFVSGLFGAAAHYILNTHSLFPMIGASGGLSGLFAAAIVMLNRGQREMGGRIGILPFALLWIGLSIAFGMLGGPDGSMIAWAAHVGGFLGGFAVLKAMKI